MSFQNYLSLPQPNFGISGINTGNIVHDRLQIGEIKHEVRYDSDSRHIVVLDSSDLSIEALDKILYEDSSSSNYYGWFPKVEKKRNGDGNLLIKFSCFHPHSDSSQSELMKPILRPLEGFSGIILPQKTPFTSEEVSMARSALSRGVTEALIKIMSNNRQEFKGVWYPTDLKKYFSNKQNEMPSDYWSGYANPEYFEKTGRFTFELKQGKSASEAINVLIEGPSVLDCGNSTQLAYYKAILDIIGPEKFDFIFSSNLFKLKITQKGITDNDAPISYFADYTDASEKRLEGTIGNRPVKVGEECHFKGVKCYANKHPDKFGFAGGWNVVCVGKNEMGEQLFVAHGFDAPKTEKEINKLLVESYNQERTPEEQEFISKVNKPTFYNREINSFLRNFYTVPVELSDKIVAGFLVGSCRGLNPETVLQAKKEKVDSKFILKLVQKSFPA